MMKKLNKKMGSFAFVLTILFILLIILIFLFAQKKPITGKAVQENEKIKIITDCGEGTILYDFSEVCWQKFQMPLSADNWTEADSYCKNLELSEKNNWRLPTLTELDSIKKYMNSTSNIFNDTRFWSSTHGPDDWKNYHMYLDFRSKYKSPAPDSREGYGVKCLRENI